MLVANCLLADVTLSLSEESQVTIGLFILTYAIAVGVAAVQIWFRCLATEKEIKAIKEGKIVEHAKLESDFTSKVDGILKKLDCIEKAIQGYETRLVQLETKFVAHITEEDRFHREIEARFKESD